MFAAIVVRYHRSVGVQRQQMKCLAAAVAVLSSRLRDQVDVDALAGDVTAVVGVTVRPVSVSLWLASAAPPEAARP